MGRLDQADAKGRLPALVSAAANRLAAATSSAEVLDARDMADAAYHAAKTAARMIKAKDAPDELLIAAYRTRGRLVPISHVESAVPYRRFALSEERVAA